MKPANSERANDAGRHITTDNRFRRILFTSRAKNNSKLFAHRPLPISREPKIFGPKFAVSARPKNVTASSESNSRLRGHQRYVQSMPNPQPSPSVAVPQPPSPSVAIKMLLAKPLVKIKLLFMVASFISLVLSVSLYFNGHEQQGIYVGIWVPSILSLGSLLLAGERGE
jgi:hypothetical protein